MAITDGVAQSVGAGGNVNLFLGRASEFPGGQAALTEQLFMDADAPGLTVSLAQNVGGTPLAPIQGGTPINCSSSDPLGGTGPKLNEDLVGTFAVPSGCRQALNVYNSNTAAVIVRYRNFITP